MSKTVALKTIEAMVKQQDTTEIVSLPLNESTVEIIIKKRIPIESVVTIVTAITSESFDDGIFSPIAFEAGMLFKIAKAFTNLNLQSEDVKTANLLKEIDILSIIGKVTNQHTEIYDLARIAVDEEMKRINREHQNHMVAVSLGGLVAPIIDKFSSILDNIDVAKLDEIAKLVQGLNPEILNSPMIANFLNAAQHANRQETDTKEFDNVVLNEGE